MMAARYGLYAYGLAGAYSEQLAIRSIDQQHSVYTVVGESLCVMVSKIDIDRFQSQVKRVFSALTKNADTDRGEAEALLQAHENVVAALMNETTIVPLTFGTILKDEEAALKMLQDDEERFTKLLAKFAGREEWGLKIYADHQQFMQQVTRIEPEFSNLEEKRKKLSRGAAYLLGRKMEEDLKDNAAARLASVTAAIFHGLGKDAHEAKLTATLPQKLTGKRQEMILNAAYLVEREKVAQFCRQGQRLREQYEPPGLDFEISGPWPPYNFT